ncbi:MAG: sulfite exporter TauE/SafE family protein [Actinobacteria bacterium]|nr:sulfite exporter TauE/SafE family protein [Actinomycetota bacterium]
MSAPDALLVVVAGVWAGAINTLVGSGSLVTFPVLLAVGFPPLTANVSNNVGLVPGSVSGAYGFRRELRGQRARLLRFAPASLLGGLAGAVLLLVLPASAFEAIVPVFVALGVVLVIVQPRVNRWLARRRAADAHGHGGAPALLATWLTGVYGGYFGAAQGVLLLAILGIAIDDDLHRVNALKVVLAGLVNFVAAVVFALAAHVAWEAVALIAVGSAIGGQLGARVGRRLPAPALRAVIVVVGLAAIAKLLLD